MSEISVNTEEMEDITNQLIEILVTLERLIEVEGNDGLLRQLAVCDAYQGGKCSEEISRITQFSGVDMDTIPKDFIGKIISLQSYINIIALYIYDYNNEIMNIEQTGQDTFTEMEVGG